MYYEKLDIIDRHIEMLWVDIEVQVRSSSVDGVISSHLAERAARPVDRGFSMEMRGSWDSFMRCHLLEA